MQAIMLQITLIMLAIFKARKMTACLVNRILARLTMNMRRMTSLGHS